MKEEQEEVAVMGGGLPLARRDSCDTAQGATDAAQGATDAAQGATPEEEHARASDDSCVCAKLQESTYSAHPPPLLRRASASPDSAALPPPPSQSVTPPPIGSVHPATPRTQQRTELEFWETFVADTPEYAYTYAGEEAGHPPIKSTQEDQESKRQRGQRSKKQRGQREGRREGQGEGQRQGSVSIGSPVTLDAVNAVILDAANAANANAAGPQRRGWHARGAGGGSRSGGGFHAGQRWVPVKLAWSCESDEPEDSKESNAQCPAAFARYTRGQGVCSSDTSVTSESDKSATPPAHAPATSPTASSFSQEGRRSLSWSR